MKKNGFTLVELIATIGLMVLVGIVIATNISGLFSKQQDQSFEDFQKTLQDAACTYIDLSDPDIKNKKAKCKVNECKVSASILIHRGLLDENLINPNTERKITGSESISIKYVDGEKICTYS